MQTHDFRPNLAPKVVKKRAKDRKRSQKWAKSGPKGAKGGQMGAKRKAKGAKRESKWPKREPTGAKGGPKGAKKTTKMRSKIDVRKRSPKRVLQGGGRMEFLGSILGSFSIKKVIKNQCKNRCPESKDFWCQNGRKAVPKSFQKSRFFQLMCIKVTFWKSRFRSIRVAKIKVLQA